MKIEWDEGEAPHEDDLWKLFSDHPDKPSDEIQYYTDIKTLLAKMKLKDETRFYKLSTQGMNSESLEGGLVRATVSQRNLYRVAKLMTGRVSSITGYGRPETAIQYLGPRDRDAVARRKSATKTPDLRQAKTKQHSVKRDSIDKIVTSYFATLTSESFEWRGKTYEPRDVHVSPLILRGYTCPAGCGGCCPRFSLDYIEPDGVPDGHPLAKRIVEFDGREVEVWSDLQTDHKGPKCRNLNLDNGRCRIHGNQPFSCDFELLRMIIHEVKAPRADITQKLYGRGWAMMRVDGKRGALCEMTMPSPESIADVDRRLARLETWMEHFGLNPVRVGMVRRALPEIAQTGKPFSIGSK